MVRKIKKGNVTNIPNTLDTDFIRVKFYVQYPFLSISSIKGIISPSIKYNKLKYAHHLLQKQLDREVQDISAILSAIY